jgi:hypothetical protein
MQDEASGVALGSLHAGPLYPREESAPSGRWCLMFGEPGDDDGLWCLSSGEQFLTYHLYVFCGGETAILASCAVPLSLVLAAIARCCEQGGRADGYEWLDAIDGMNL